MMVSAVAMSAAIVRAVIVPIAAICVLVDPTLHIDGLARRIEQCGAEQRVRRDLAVGDKVLRRPGVKRDEPPPQFLYRLR